MMLWYSPISVIWSYTTDFFLTKSQWWHRGREISQESCCIDHGWDSGIWVPYSRDSYSTADDINGDGMKFAPASLTLLLKRLIRSPLKKAAIGQCVVHAARSRDSLMSLLSGVGVDLAFWCWYWFRSMWSATTHKTFTVRVQFVSWRNQALQTFRFADITWSWRAGQ